MEAVSDATRNWFAVPGPQFSYFSIDSYKMDIKSENPPVRTFDLNSDPINVFMSPKLAQSFGTVS